MLLEDLPHNLIKSYYCNMPTQLKADMAEEGNGILNLRKTSSAGLSPQEATEVALQVKASLLRTYRQWCRRPKELPAGVCCPKFRPEELDLYNHCKHVAEKACSKYGLNKVQQRIVLGRLSLYKGYKETLEDIAKEINCSKRVVHYYWNKYKNVVRKDLLNSLEK